MVRSIVPPAAVLLAAALGLAACGRPPAAVRTPPPPPGFVDVRTLPLGQTRANDYDKVLETGLAEQDAAWSAPDARTTTYRAPASLGRAAITAYYDKAAAERGWAPDPTLRPSARSPLAGQYWSFGYRADDRRFMVAGVEPGPALAVPAAGLPVVVRSNAD
ncbi:hypothetical protein [Caulobacter sp. LARHSG274]